MYVISAEGKARKPFLREKKGVDERKKVENVLFRSLVIQAKQAMDVLPVTFAILRFCGAWRERERTVKFLPRLLHFSYRFAVAFLIYHFTISELIELMLCVGDIASFTETLFVTITYVGLCVKFVNFSVRQKEFKELLDLLRSSTCRPRDSIERDIIAKYNQQVKLCTLAFFVLCQLTACLIAISPFFGAKGTESPLPLRVYLPYSTSNDLAYLATYIQQSSVLVYGVSLNVSIDSLVYGFNLLACAQIELISYRFNKIYQNAEPNGSNEAILRRHLLTRDCIKHHLLLHKFVDRLQSFFMWTVAVFFSISLIALCTSIFQISKHSVLSIEFMTLVGYLMSMLFQIFSYCWYGNELELKSKSVADAVYFSNWTSVTPRERRSLLIVMTISQKGLILSYYGIIVVAVHTFMWVIKTAYSSYNLLQQVSH